MKFIKCMRIYMRNDRECSLSPTISSGLECLDEPKRSHFPGPFTLEDQLATPRNLVA